MEGLIVNATNRPIAAIGALAISPARGPRTRARNSKCLAFFGSGEAIPVHPKPQVSLNIKLAVGNNAGEVDRLCFSCRSIAVLVD
jgi:hypothetical protein